MLYRLKIDYIFNEEKDVADFIKKNTWAINTVLNIEKIDFIVIYLATGLTKVV